MSSSPQAGADVQQDPRCSRRSSVRQQISKALFKFGPLIPTSSIQAMSSPMLASHCPGVTHCNVVRSPTTSCPAGSSWEGEGSQPPRARVGDSRFPIVACGNRSRSALPTPPSTPAGSPASPRSCFSSDPRSPARSWCGGSASPVPASLKLYAPWTPAGGLPRNLDGRQQQGHEDPDDGKHEPTVSTSVKQEEIPGHKERRI